MKLNRYWNFVLAVVAMSCLSPAANCLTFTDGFSNLDNWTLYGTPTPQRLASIHGKTGVFDNNGDGTDKSGAISVKTFGLTGGFTITSQVYLDFTDTTLCNGAASIGIANPTLQAWGGYDPYVYFSIGGMGVACTSIAESLRGHAYFFGEFQSTTGKETFEPNEGDPSMFLADTYKNTWVTLKIEVSAASVIKFYVDTVLVYTGAHNLSNTIATGAYPLWIGSSSDGAGDKAYHDSLTLVASCDPPVAPTLSSPANAAVVCNTLVQFVWGDVTGATYYQLQVDNNSNFGSPESDLQFTPPTHSVSIVKSDDCLPQYWRVRAKNGCNWGDWSSTRTVTVCSSPAVPTLATPDSGVTNVTQPIVLDWSDVDGITYYDLELDTSASFATPVHYQPTVSIDTISQLAGSTDYYWRVRAHNGCANSLFSEVHGFTTEVCNLPVVATLFAPGDADSAVIQPVDLYWSTTAEATWYQVQVDTAANFATIIDSTSLADTTLQLSGLAGRSVYYWRVRGANGCGFGDWSDTIWFKTCYMSAVANLTAPVDGDTIDPKPIAFDWDNVAGASKYRFQVDDTISFAHPIISEQLVASQFGTYDLDYETKYYWRVQAYDTCGWGDWTPVRSCSTITSLLVGVHDETNLPTEFALSQNYPNPFNPTTVIEFALPKTCQVSLDVFDIIGRKVRTLVAGTLTAGRRQVIWDGSNTDGSAMASGVYFYRIKAGDYNETRKMLLLK